MLSGRSVWQLRAAFLQGGISKLPTAESTRRNGTDGDNNDFSNLPEKGLDNPEKKW
jgi:hypothetical protein